MRCTLLLFLFLGTMSVSAQTKYFTSFDDTKIAYTDEGDGRPILLIHGFIQSGESWNTTALKAALLEKGYRVIVPDLRGNGDSDKPHDDDAYSKDAEIMDLLFLMADLRIRKYNAVGYSRGSIVLANLLTKTRRIKKAVLGGMGIDFTNRYWRRRALFRDAFNGNITEETEAAVAYAKSIGADLKCLYLQQKHQPYTSKRQLQFVTAKILVIAGSEDTENGDPEALSKAFSKSKFRIVEGNHNDTYRSKAFSDEIMAFF